MKDAVNAIAEIRAEALSRTSPAQLAIERAASVLGRPWFACGAIAFVLAWIAGDIVAARVAGKPFDPGQLPSLQLVISIFSFLLAALILVAENRQSEVAERRAQVTLQIAVVAEQKIAKLIELVERLREDDPNLPDRPDREAAKMAEATDVKDVLHEMERAEERALESKPPASR